jgi:hypothetical protein
VKKLLGVVLGSLAVMVVGAGTALAQASPATVIGDAAEDVQTQLVAVAGAVLPYAAILVALVLGWRFARRFLRA